MQTKVDNKIIKRRQTKICKATTYLLTMFYALKFSRVQMSSVNRLRFGRQPPLTVSRTSHKSLTDSDGIRTFGRNVSSLNVLTLVIQFIEAEACVVAMIFFVIIYFCFQFSKTIYSIYGILNRISMAVIFELLSFYSTVIGHRKKKQVI